MSSILARLDEGIGSDENVVFYPSVAKNPDDGSDCKVEVRGRISEERHLQEVTTIALTLAGVPRTDAPTCECRCPGFQARPIRRFVDRLSAGTATAADRPCSFSAPVGHGCVRGTGESKCGVRTAVGGFGQEGHRRRCGHPGTRSPACEHEAKVRSHTECIAT